MTANQKYAYWKRISGDHGQLRLRYCPKMSMFHANESLMTSAVSNYLICIENLWRLAIAMPLGSGATTDPSAVLSYALSRFRRLDANRRDVGSCGRTGERGSVRHINYDHYALFLRQEAASRGPLAHL
ncbi:MAG: hypothetical protein OEZ08_08015 [Betaproteobacteria bacterium]|nr:hypothetical protein [Betaproteobacteria bacterium]